MKVHRAELQLDRRGAPEEVTDGELVRHAHAAVNLHCALADQAARLIDGYLCSGRSTCSLLGGRGEAQCCEVRSRARQLDFHAHVHQPMLQHLEPANWLAELSSLLRILERVFVEL